MILRKYIIIFNNNQEFHGIFLNYSFSSLRFFIVAQLSHCVNVNDFIIFDYFAKKS